MNNMKYELYEVGGKIRDEILGLKSKDVDYSVVIESKHNLNVVFSEFEQQLIKEGYDVFLTTEDCFTIRAKFPKDHKYSGVADFVLARKDLYYPSVGRKPVTKLGTLQDDLARRDFTCNAIAKAEDGSFTDPFNGAQDIGQGILRTTKDAGISFNEDPLRILRAIRFCITKRFMLSDNMVCGLWGFDATRFNKNKVSTDRIMKELIKCFKYSTPMTLHYLNLISKENYLLYNAILRDDLWFKPTMENR